MKKASRLHVNWDGVDFMPTVDSLHAALGTNDATFFLYVFHVEHFEMTRRRINYKYYLRWTVNMRRQCSKNLSTLSYHIRCQFLISIVLFFVHLKKKQQQTEFNKITNDCTKHSHCIKTRRPENKPITNFLKHAKKLIEHGTTINDKI